MLLCNIILHLYENDIRIEVWIRLIYFPLKIINIKMYDFRYLKSDRATILVNLCIALILSYILFMAGVTQTENQVFGITSVYTTCTLKSCNKNKEMCFTDNWYLYSFSFKHLWWLDSVKKNRSLSGI